MSKQAASLPQKKQLLALYRQAVREGVSLKDLDKKVAYFSKRSQANKKGELAFEKKHKQKLWSRLPLIIKIGAGFLPLALIIIGFVLAGSAVWPILSSYLPSQNARAEELLAPIPRSQVMDSTPLVIAEAKIFDENESFGEELINEPIILDQALDFTDLNNWFVGDLGEDSQAASEFVEYSLDIPSLKISNAKVRVGGTDLNKSLIQYPGTALPGQSGAPVIFGHSVLRQFYNPSEKNPKRYNSVFSTIMTLDKGDKIYLTYNNVKYTYSVQSQTEVKPDDTFILAQRYDARQLKIVTCTPEGTTLRRGVVTAQLVKE